ncbi:MAG: hypothetical protein AAF196_04925 [Planctomycetota bacterium]
MTESKKPGAFALAKWPILISLALMLARLGGELAGLEVMIGDKNLFSTEAGGGGSPLGMTPLILLFGFVFGWRLTGLRDAPDRPGLAILFYVGGLVALAVPMWIALGPLGLKVGPQIAPWLGGGSVAALAISYRAWPAHWKTSFVYAVCTRLPVVALTFLLVYLDADTHFSKLPPDAEGIETKMDRAVALSLAQVTFWPVATICIGGFFGVVASAVRGRRKDDQLDHA